MSSEPYLHEPHAHTLAFGLVQQQRPELVPAVGARARGEGDVDEARGAAAGQGGVFLGDAVVFQPRCLVVWGEEVCEVRWCGEVR